MSKKIMAGEWREGRRQAARAAIVDAAWALVADEGLAALSMRELAGRAGISTPTVYAYFESKNDIYDAMFSQAAQQFAAHMAATPRASDARETMIAAARRFTEFCTADVPRYQLLFQRTIPGFEPSPDAYAHAIGALDALKQWLAEIGITDPTAVDLWTALATGLVDQQVSNDPGGERWTRLVDDAVDMFLTHCRRTHRTHRASTRTVRAPRSNRPRGVSR